MFNRLFLLAISLFLLTGVNPAQAGSEWPISPPAPSPAEMSGMSNAVIVGTEADGNSFLDPESGMICSVVSQDEFMGMISGEIGEYPHADARDFRDACTIHPSGLRWDDSDIPVPFWADPDGTPDCAGEFRALVKAGLAWNRVPGSSFLFSIGGFTNDPAPLLNGRNQIAWSNEPEGIFYTLTLWYSGSRFIEADIVLNDRYTWSNRKDWCPSGEFDVQNCVTHILGQVRGLERSLDPGCVDATMYLFGPGEIIRRTLEEPDKSALVDLYPE